MTRRVVITGLGACTSAGNVIASWGSVLNKKSWVKKNTKFDITNFKSKIASFVNINDELIKSYEQVISLKERIRMDDVSYIAIISAYNALIDSGFLQNDAYCEDGKILLKNFNQITSINTDRFGTFIGSGMGGVKSFQNGVKLLSCRGEKCVSPFFFPCVLPNMSAGYIALKFGLKGATMSHSSACATSAHSIGEAFNYIKEGKLDYCLAGGSEMSICEMGIAGFDAMNALSTACNDSPELASRPLDVDRDGFVMGEGSAILVMEELEMALKRGAKIYCEVAGYGASCDACNIVAPHPEGKGASSAMSMALKDAELKPENIDYINLHGTSTKLGDVAEITAIKNTFKEYASKVAISSTKSITGHLLGTAGAIEAIFCVKALEEQIIPPSINIFNLDESCKDMNVVTDATKQDINVTMSNSFGFGGTNGCLIFKKYEK